MSAISGVLYFNKKEVNFAKKITTGIDHLKNFHFDDIGTWKKGNIILECHSQWITPESVDEVLPYYDYERKVAITADAIIDNRKELFDILQVNRNVRKTMPDSQLIVLAYQKWGADAPKYLIGDFAFVIWDEKNKKLFAARDFSGSRTLYFYHDDNHFAFSTLIEPLFTLPYINKKLNEEYLAEFLAVPGNTEAVDMTTTIYQSIKQIPPSHSLTLSEGDLTLRRYYKIEVENTIKLKTNEEYEEAFLEIFSRAVTDRLRTYGNVGSQLSGGLDSGSVVSVAAKELSKENKRLHTFSYIPQDDFSDWTSKYYLADETPFIKETVNFVGNIEDHYLSFEGKNSLVEIDDFLEIMEMPYKFFENSFWLKGINQIANERGIKIMLNGARGNHSISWGSYSLNLNYYSKLLKKFRWLKLNEELESYCNTIHSGKKVMLPLVIKNTFGYGKGFSNSTKLINPQFAEKYKVYEKLKEKGVDVSGAHPTNLTAYRLKYFQQLHTWNNNGIVGTKLSLRNGVWDRDPTNDLRVIKFCLSLPEVQFVTKGMDRSLIRRATKGLLPNSVRLNHNKRGIQSADTIHRMKPQWKEFMNEVSQLTDDPIVSEFLNIDAINKSLSKFKNNPKPELVLNNQFKILVHSLIIKRFLNQFN
ncbi:asparagine synthase-related protein [Halalkalibacter akibai]|uniref:asparagine synthase (glutamine-hydrolyzing) n=1 Tax=Halalkalibacter akibai (strain ATCC 43226 / DSM 21942 / CIP 109018 / JCM 9157 / 1139) TaxID=1236973 RepID=W4QUY4_HALA3|nr:asparagine synthase-related protein [Halalkalibacter akibai]GAE35940.1 asparagine synthetase [Halalkalibacter akibai JCM 9157]